jgi:hypothetical protein
MTITKLAVCMVALAMVLMFAGVSSADLNDGLVAYYPFNGNANDESGNENDGIVYGATLTDDRCGKPESAYSFDGVDDYIDIMNNVKPPFPVTVSTWVKLNNEHTGCVFRNDRYDNTSYRYGLSILYGTGGQLEGCVFEGFSAPWNRVCKVSSDSVISIGDWHHFVVVFHALNNIQLFWDAVEYDGYYDGTGSSLSYSTANGAIGKTSISQYAVDGALDDIRVYNRALSEAEIQELYNETCQVSVEIDIKPCSCPNPLNMKSKGVLPVAVLGTDDCDVTGIDPASIRIEGIAPICSNVQDVSTPVVDPQDVCECIVEDEDGFDDLTLKFDTQAIVGALGDVNDGDELVLTLTGRLLDGTPIEGQDCIVIGEKGKDLTYPQGEQRQQ